MEAILFDILYFHRSLNLFPVELQKSRGSQRLYSSMAGSEEAQASSLASWSTNARVIVQQHFLYALDLSSASRGGEAPSWDPTGLQG